MLKEFIQYYKPHKRLFFADMLCALIVALCNLIYPYYTGRFINDYMQQSTYRPIVAAGAILLLVYIVKACLTYFIQYYGHIMGVRMQCDMRQDGFNHLQQLPFSYFDHARTGGIMSRLINDTMDITELAHHGPEDLFISTITILGAFIILLKVNTPLTLIIFSLIPVLIFFALKMRLKLSSTSMKTRQEVGEINSTLENSIAGIRVAKAYDAFDYEQEKFAQGNASFAHASSTRYKAMAEFFSGTGFIIDLLSLATLVLGGLYAWRGDIQVGDFTQYLMYVGIFTDPIKRLINFVEQYQAGVTGFIRLKELMGEAHEEDSPEAVPLTQVTGHIQYNQITFRYDTGHENVFTNLSLDIKAGETVALVGPSGGGKSTLCHLLPRFYELTGGEILLDGVAITDYTRLSLREQIGLVQQDTFLFTGTIRDNIAYGNFYATHQEVMAAAKAANIHEYIASLPDGYDTFVGERGVMLSGGQKQRVSIARVFLKNPPILILDEATSALDNTTEQAIQSALNQLSQGRTTLVVAHRLSTIRSADKIVYIANNEILEEGTHDQLLKAASHYAQLWNAQLLEPES